MHPPSDFNYFKRMINLDISNKCRLQCPSCDRVLDRSMVNRAKDISLEDYQKIIDTFPNVEMCGQISDPIYHPKFTELLQMSKDLSHLDISTNGSGKKQSWWENVFQITLDNDNTSWRFALDGLPSESHIYRVNQDGEQVWEMMKIGASMGVDITWQYIPFLYNQDHVEEARQMAHDNNIKFLLKISNRHPSGMRPTIGALRVDYVEIEA